VSADQQPPSLGLANRSFVVSYVSKSTTGIFKDVAKNKDDMDEVDVEEAVSECYYEHLRYFLKLCCLAFQSERRR